MPSDWALTLKNLFFPTVCQLCGRRLLTEENGYFCPTCWEESPRIERPFCTICGRPHRGTVGFGTRHNFPCDRCRPVSGAQRPVRRVFGAARFDGAVELAVKLLKFHDKPRVARPLGELMVDFARREMDCDAYAALVPVPLHRVRQRARGYNQSALLAAQALQAFPYARLDTSLTRIRPTRVQSRLTSEAERRMNVADAFAMKDGAQLRGETVLLVDDVVTTGGTVAACAGALRAAGAVAVDVLAAALAVAPATGAPGKSRARQPSLSATHISRAVQRPET